MVSVESAASDLSSITLGTFALCHQSFKTYTNKNSIHSVPPKQLLSSPLWLEGTSPFPRSGCFPHPSTPIHPPQPHTGAGLGTGETEIDEAQHPPPGHPHSA